MNVREYLQGYNQIDNEIRFLNDEMNTLLKCREETYSTLKAQVLSDMPKAPHLDGNDCVSKTVLLINERFSQSIDSLSRQINDLLYMRDIFSRVWIQKGLLSNKEKSIIDLRYFHNKRWEDIANKACYSEKQCRRIAEGAVLKMQKVIDILEGSKAIRTCP